MGIGIGTGISLFLYGSGGTCRQGSAFTYEIYKSEVNIEVNVNINQIYKSDLLITSHRRFPSPSSHGLRPPRGPGGPGKGSLGGLSLKGRVVSMVWGAPPLGPLWKKNGRLNLSQKFLTGVSTDLLATAAGCWAQARVPPLKVGGGALFAIGGNEAQKTNNYTKLIAATTLNEPLQIKN